MAGNGDAITTKFKVDISDLKKGISEANRNMKLANAEFKAASSGMKDWEKSSTGISAKLKQLGSVLTEQNAKLKAYQQQQQRVDDAYAKNKAKADELKAAMAQLASQGVAKTSAEYKKYEKALSEVEKEAAANKRTSEDLKVTILNQQAAINKTTAEQKKYESSLKQVEQAEKAAAKSGKSVEEELKNLESQAEKTDDKVSKLGDGIKKGLAGAAKIGAAALAAAGAAVVGLATQAISSYAEYEQLVGGVDTLFGDASKKVQEYAANAYKTAGMSANEYMETVTGFSASLLQSLGGDTKKAAEVADLALTDMSDNANKMGTDMEMIKNAYGGFAKQNYTMLDNLKLGYGGTKTEMERLLKDAEKLSGQKYDIDSLNDVYQAIHVVQEEMGITGTTAKEAATTIQGSVGMMKGAWSNLMTGMADDTQDFDQLLTNFIDSIGAVISNVLPRVQTVIGSVFKLVEGLLPEIPPLINQLLPEIVKGATTLVEGLLNALPQIFDAIINVLPQLTQAILNMLPQLVTVGVQLIQSLLTGLSTMLPQIIVQIVEIIPQIVDALVSGLPLIINGAIQLLMGIVQALPTIIQALAAATPQLVNSMVQILTQSVPTLLQGALQLLDAIVKAIPLIIPPLIAALPALVKGMVTALVGGLPQLLQGAIQLLMAIIDAIPVIVNLLVPQIPVIIDAIVNALTANMPAIVNAAVQLFMGIMKAIPQIVSALAKAVPQIITGIVKGLVAGIKSIGNAAIKLGKALIDSFKKVLGINSPSTVMLNIGKNLVTGLINGIKNLPSKVAEITKKVLTKITSWGKDIASKATSAGKTFLSNVVKFFSDLPSKISKTLSSVITKISSWASDLGKKGTEAAKKLFDNVINGLKDLPSKMASVGKNVTEGIWKGITGAKDWLLNKIKSFAGSITDGIKSFFKIKSPSRVMRDEVGVYIAQGIAAGITKGGNTVITAMRKLANDTITIAKTTFQNSGFDTVTTGVIDNMSDSIDAYVKQSTKTIKNLVNTSLDTYNDGIDAQIKDINDSVKRQTDQTNTISTKNLNQQVSNVNKIVKSQTDEINKELKKQTDSINKSVKKQVEAINSNKSLTKEQKKKQIAAIKERGKAEIAELKENAKNQIETIKENGKNQITALKEQSKKMTKAQIEALKKSSAAEIEELKKKKDNYKAAGEAAVKAYTEALKNFADKAKDVISTAMNAVNQEFQSKYDELVQSQKSMQDKLSKFGDLFTMNDNGTMTINNLNEQTAAITKYASDLNKIKNKVSDELFDAISDMSVEEGQKYVNKLFAMSDDELKAYDNAYRIKLDASKKLTEKMYNNDLKKLNAEYNKAVDKALGGLAGELKEIGRQAMAGFIEGMGDETDEMASEIQKIANNIVNEFKKSFSIHSPSKVFANEIGKFIPSGIALGIENNAKALMESVRGLTTQAVGLSQSMLSGLQAPMLATAGAGSTTTTTSVVNNFNQTINAPKQPSRIELYRQTKNLLNLKGGA